MRRTLVLGLDGATFRVLDPLMDAGELPNLAALQRQGVSGDLESTMPPVTGPAWLSLATGLTPGSTGVYDFIRRDPEADGYDFTYIDSSSYRGRAVWDYLGEGGVEVGVVDYPTLSPPYAVDGFMLAGGLGASETRSYPESLLDDLGDLPTVDSHLDIGAEKYADVTTFMDDIEANVDARATRLERLLDREPWQFCWAVLQEPDWVQHRMWRFFDESHPAAELDGDGHDRFVSFWRRIDDIVGRCRQRLDEDDTIVIQSDHGFGPMDDRSLRLNTWLQNQGYLAAKSGGNSRFWLQKRLWNLLSDVAATINLSEIAPRLFRWGKNELSGMAIELNSIDLTETTAFDPGHIQSMGGLYVNEAVVTDPDERARRLAEIRARLGDLAEKHELPLETYTPEELYGKRAPGSPDLLVRVDGVNVENGGWDRPVVDRAPDRLEHQSGSHRRDGIFIAAGPEIEPGEIEGARIWDVAPTLLHLFDQPVPESMDGDVLTGALAGDRTVTYRSTADDAATERDRTRREDDAMKEQLRDLGYFE